MKLPIPLLSAIETAFNSWLKLDGESLPRMQALEDKIIQIHITGLEINLYFLPSKNGIQVLGNYPNHTEGGMVDATIHGSPLALITLATTDNAGESLLKSDVEIDGDMRVAEQFSAILRDVDIDWEEHLSGFVGDIVAYQAGNTVRGVTNWIKDTHQSMKMNSAEYITEEAHLSPADAEVRYFMDQVDDIRLDVDRLEARIKILQNKQETADLKQ